MCSEQNQDLYGKEITKKYTYLLKKHHFWISLEQFYSTVVAKAKVCKYKEKKIRLKNGQKNAKLCVIDLIIKK